MPDWNVLEMSLSACYHGCWSFLTLTWSMLNVFSFFGLVDKKNASDDLSELFCNHCSLCTHTGTRTRTHARTCTLWPADCCHALTHLLSFTLRFFVSGWDNTEPLISRAVVVTHINGFIVLFAGHCWTRARARTHTVVSVGSAPPCFLVKKCSPSVSSVRIRGSLSS